MGLELKIGRDGQPIDHWFARYTDKNGKRLFTALKTKVAGIAPEGFSLKRTGDATFEASRKAAEDELAGFLKEATETRDAAYHIQKLVEKKTNTKWEEPLLDVLPDLIRDTKHRRQRSQQHEVWKFKTVQNFVAWAKGRELRKVLEITPEVAGEYIETLFQPNEQARTRTAESIRKVKAVVGHALKMALPRAIENPFKSVVVETSDGDKVYNREPLNAVEIERLLEAASSDRTAFDLIVTGLSTGLRRGDVCRLRWASVDLKNWVLKLTTSKTRAELYLPIMPRLRTVLEGRLADREANAEYVFPEAEQQLRTNPSGVSWRIKRAFALAFAKPPEAKKADAPKLVPLSETLPQVLKAVQEARMSVAKREKMVDLLNRYATGQSYREIQQDRRISRGGISMLLHEAEQLAGVRFLPDSRAAGINAAIKTVTRTDRLVGLKAASKYDFHGLRTTFVTLALNAGISEDKLKALTGHHTVEVVLKHYFKPKGTDVADELQAAFPAALTGRDKTEANLVALPAKHNPLASLAAQIKDLTKADRAQLAAMLRKAEGATI